jgi:hypothetical protein
MDLDDYWSPGIHHPAYYLIKNNGLDIKILSNIKQHNMLLQQQIFLQKK